MDIIREKIENFIKFVFSAPTDSLKKDILKKEQKSHDYKSPLTPPLSPLNPISNKQVLILVINVLKAEIIEHLKTKITLKTEDCEILYSITESLWVGSQTKLSAKLDNCFSKDNQFVVAEGEESEYDVYLIKIELPKSYKGFEPNANQIDRSDAFSTLAGLSVKSTSPRLRVEAYENTGVYIC